jgi:predicted AAA+ superfamily ATPase
MILRNLSSELQRRLTLYPAVAILGPRQVGKTTLVKQLLHANPESYLYLDLENFEHRQILGEDRFFFSGIKLAKPSSWMRFNLFRIFSKIYEV